MIDYEQIVKDLKDEEVIRLMYELGVDRHEETDNYIIFPTICHNENATEASMKLYYYKDTHLLYCYTEDGPMSIYKFLENYYKTRNIEYNWGQDILKVVFQCSAATELTTKETIFKHSLKDKYRKRQSIQLAAYSPNVLESFVKQYPIEWLEDNISAGAMDKYNIRYSISQNKIIIPHYDINNRLVGIRGRALNESEIAYAKYAPVKIEDIVYKHKLSLNLYGLNHNWKNIKELGICYIAESEKAVLQSELFGEKNCTVAICGSSLNIYQIKLLMQHCQPKEIVLCLDKEELPGEDKYFYKLWDMCSKYKLYTNMSFIYDRENLLNLKDSPFDRGRNIFNKLLEKRVKVK